MKKTIWILSISTTLMAGIILSGYMFTNQKQAYAGLRKLPIKADLKSVRSDPNTKAVKVIYSNEWKTFKKESEYRIMKQDSILAGLNAKPIIKDDPADELFRKSLANLDQQINYMKDRLTAYDKSPANWESFKKGFNRESGLISISLTTLTDSSKNN